ncbi:hypothetical protein JTE90_007554 [Oedothorax gibbosus]|uniref:Uncharacterized protein n=1 Tax=Oedothorax gibbosus TaxID=931172 RepID=A0AAV6VM55_9ARAC|nr:hypothetical protein JTE90_007554 [Oedothorax gibbosus]
MFAKVLFLIVITAVVCAPIDQADEDIPVYTEKVVKAKPTKPGGSVTRVPRFHSKKLSSLAKQTPTPASQSDDAGEPYPIPDATSAPEEDLKPAKPLRNNPRPYKRNPSHPKNVIVNEDYPRRKPSLRVGYNAPRPSYAKVPQLGVEYAPEVLQNAYEPPQKLVDEYKPRKPVVRHYNDYDSAVGNAPQLNYAQAPKEIELPAERNYGYANNDYVSPCFFANF